MEAEASRGRYDPRTSTSHAARRATVRFRKAANFCMTINGTSPIGSTGPIYSAGFRQRTQQLDTRQLINEFGTFINCAVGNAQSNQDPFCDFNIGNHLGALVEQPTGSATATVDSTYSDAAEALWTQPDARKAQMVNAMAARQLFVVAVGLNAFSPDGGFDQGACEGYIRVHVTDSRQQAKLLTALHETSNVRWQLNAVEPGRISITDGIGQQRTLHVPPATPEELDRCACEGGVNATNIGIWMLRCLKGSPERSAHLPGVIIDDSVLGRIGVLDDAARVALAQRMYVMRLGLDAFLDDGTFDETKFSADALLHFDQPELGPVEQMLAAARNDGRGPLRLHPDSTSQLPGRVTVIDEAGTRCEIPTLPTLSALPVDLIRELSPWLPILDLAAMRKAQSGLAKATRAEWIQAKKERSRFPLHRASASGRLEIVRALLDGGGSQEHRDTQVPVDAKDLNGRTALHRAVAAGHHDVATLRLERGASLHSLDRDRKTPLHAACEKGDRTAVALLLGRGASANGPESERDSYGTKTPLQVACKTGNLDVVGLLLEHGANMTESTINGFALHVAARAGHIDVVRLLLARGADVNQSHSVRGTPLHAACEGGKANIVALLLERGGSLVAENKEGETPLHSAAWGGNTEVISLLLDRGANIHARERFGETPLHQACYGRKPDAVALLLERGARIDAQNGNGDTPLHVASNGDADVFKLLLDRNAGTEAKSFDSGRA